MAGGDPSQAVRRESEALLGAQEPSARLDWIRLVLEPAFLTGGRKVPEDPDKIIVTRTDLAAPFELQLSSDTGIHQLRGVFLWVALGFDGAARPRLPGSGRRTGVATAAVTAATNTP